MKTKLNKFGLVLFTMVLTISLTNCKAVQNANNKQKGAVIGATGGAILGAIIGNNVGKGGNGELGAVIGGRRYCGCSYWKQNGQAGSKN